MTNKRPKIGITMGDPSGIGPEVCIKALAKQEIYRICRPMIIGDAGVMIKAAGAVDKKIKIIPIAEVKDAGFEFGKIDVLDMKSVDISRHEYGKVSAESGRSAFLAIEKVIGLALEKKLDATVTAPINKEAVNLAGYHFAGHTEIYAHYTGTSNYSMMLAEGDLRVIHISTHVSLRKACDLVLKDRVLEVIELAHKACRELGISAPKIGVAGLNPHAGENGMFGTEEQEEIIPAVIEAVSKGINADGPIPADTIFSKAKGGIYDIVVAMYHDQGHIPLKLAGFEWNSDAGRWESVNGVNITLGLPIIRTSVDHGTAFDIAGLGIASEKSMITAIEYAVKMAKNKSIASKFGCFFSSTS
jgi:4-phospho-D-threonate 3-dehydrogenase / 4-phospho-D-erythronate 3-dehydrogenase